MIAVTDWRHNRGHAPKSSIGRDRKRSGRGAILKQGSGLRGTTDARHRLPDIATRSSARAQKVIRTGACRSPA